MQGWVLDQRVMNDIAAEEWGAAHRHAFSDIIPLVLLPVYI